MDRSKPVTQTILNDLQDECSQTQAGIDLLGKCGCTDDIHSISDAELMALGQQTDLQDLMASPQLLTWWNAIRMRMI